MRQLLASNPNLRAIVVLSSMTTFAYAVTFVALPVLTRIYSPRDFAYLAFFSGVVQILSVSACLRLELAVPIVKKGKDASDLVWVTLGFGLLFAAASTIFAIVGSSIENLGLVPRGFGRFLWLVPVGIFVSAGFNSLQYWNIRHSNFSLLGRLKVLQTSLGASIQIASGMVGGGAIGLLLGPVVNYGAGLVSLFTRFFLGSSQRHSPPTINEVVSLIKRNRNFPTYSTWEAILNTAAVHLPIMIIAASADGSVGGQLSLALMVMQVPMILVGNAVGQVFLADAADQHRRGSLHTYMLGYIEQLFKVGSGPLVMMAVLAPFVFPVVFGAAWRDAGIFATLLAPALLLQLVVSPVSMAIHVVGEQSMAMRLQFYGLLLRAGTTWVASLFFLQAAPLVYAITGALFYLLYLSKIARVVEIPGAVLSATFARSAKMLPVWLALAVAGAVIITLV